MADRRQISLRRPNHIMNPVDKIDDLERLRDWQKTSHTSEGGAVTTFYFTIWVYK